ncbi:MAG: rhodanese-like domain-containing protein [Gemmatimonadota bacterium]
MILKRFYDEKLAQASYLIGCAATGEALVVDPNRDVDQYVRAAEAEGVEVTHVTETHIHADFVSGARELAERTGAKLYLSDEGDENWKYAFAKEYGAVLLRDGDTFRVGNIRIDVLHTPGHTPEHVSFLVTDTAAADRPIGVLTGDFVFVGDVGRPDLLEKAAKVEGTMEAGARTLFRSLRKFKEQPDYLQIWPGHGAGSACGKGLSAIPHSTVGYERMFNWGFSIEDEDEFVQAVLAGQPEPPKYFAEMKRINKEGPRVLGGLRRPQRLPETRLARLLEEDALVVDTRHASEFAAGHVPGTINVPLNRSFTTWAGWLVPYDRDFYLVLDDANPLAVDEAVRDLAMIGLDRVAGYFGAEAVGVWAAERRELQTTPQITGAELAERLRDGSLAVLDVRGAAEWEAGHLPGVENIPVGYLLDRADEIPRDRPLVVHCQGGARSAIAASVLQANGFRDVVNLAGGFGEWEASGNPVERGAPEAAFTAA